MCGDIVLKQRLIQSLDRHPEARGIFGVSLNDRMKRDSWLENILIQRLLEPTGLSAFEDRIRMAKSVLTNYEAFIKKLPQGRDMNFDDKMLDWYAELRAIEVLEKKSFTEIASILEERSKTVEFKARIGTEKALIEVKRKRHPIETQIINYLITKLRAEHLKYPSIYKYATWIISDLLYPHARLEQRNNDILRGEIEAIVPKIIEYLRERDFSKLPKTQNIEVLERTSPPPLELPNMREITLKIQIVICTDIKPFDFDIVAMPPGGFKYSEEIIKKILDDLASSVKPLIERATGQLKECKNEENKLARHNSRKFIVVFVDLKPGLFPFKQMMREALEGIGGLEILYSSDDDEVILFLELNN